jgi:enoyl-CoA hydratase
MGTENTLIVRREPPLAWVVVNRPDARNALTTAMWQGLADRIEELSSASEIRVILLTGAGDRAFIAGADIAELKAMVETPAREAEARQFTQAVIAAITKSPKPIVAVINGDCMGGGILLAVACDLRLASTTARFAIPAVKLGVAYPPEEGVARLARLVGATAAAEILLTGRTFDAAEAISIGLLNRTHPQKDLENAAREYALEMAGCAPLAVAAHKRAIAHSGSTPSATELAELEQLVDQCYRSEDCREGLAAFLEKRIPRFAGK